MSVWCEWCGCSAVAVGGSYVACAYVADGNESSVSSGRGVGG